MTSDQRAALLIVAAATLLWSGFYQLSQHLIGASQGTVVSPQLQLEYYLDDLRARNGRPAPPDPRLVYLGIDKQTYAGDIWPEDITANPDLRLFTQQFPWNRAVWGILLDRLAGAGARVVVFDFMFPGPKEGDDRFATAVARHADKTVLAANLILRSNDSSGHGGTAGMMMYPVDSITGGLERARAVSALANYLTDPDGTIRRARYRFTDETTGELSLPALPALTAEKAGISHPALHNDAFLRFRFAGPPQSGFPYRPVYEVLVPSLWHANYHDGEFFRDKIVIIGPAANWSQDLHQTPFAQKMFGPELHLNTLNAVLTDSFLRESPLWTDHLIFLVTGLLCAAAVYRFVTVVHRLLILHALAGGLLLAALLGFNFWGWMFPLATPLAIGITSIPGAMAWQFGQEVRLRRRLRATFERYVSPKIVREVLSRPDELQSTMGGARKPCTMLFSDIRGFTTLSESADSQALVAQLNEYLTEMVECVDRHDGTLDKFIGDAVMAVWGHVTTRGPAGDAAAALAAARDMLAALDRLNLQWKVSGRPELRIGIGINHGEVIAGDMGSPRRREFTVIGDAVNLASRLEGITKSYGVPLAIGENAAALVQPAMTLLPLDLLRVSGKNKPVEAFTLPPGGIPPESLPAYAEAMRLYRHGKFKEAAAAFTPLATLWNHHPLPTLFLQRCQDLLASPPAGWNGVFTFTKK